MPKGLLPIQEDYQKRKKFNDLMQEYGNINVIVNFDLDANQKQYIKSLTFSATPNLATGTGTRPHQTQVSRLQDFERNLRLLPLDQAINFVTSASNSYEDMQQRQRDADIKRLAEEADEERLLKEREELARERRKYESEILTHQSAPEIQTQSLPDQRSSGTRVVTTRFNQEAVARDVSNNQTSQDQKKLAELKAQEDYLRKGAMSNQYRSTPHAEQMGASPKSRQQETQDIRNQYSAMKERNFFEERGMSRREFLELQEMSRTRNPFYYPSSTFSSDNVDPNILKNFSDDPSIPKSFSYVRDNVEDIKTFVSNSSLSDDQKKVMTYFFEHIKKENWNTNEGDLIKDLASSHQAYKKELARQSQEQDPNLFEQVNAFFQPFTTFLSNNHNPQSQNGQLATQTFESELKKIADIYKDSLKTSGIDIDKINQTTKPIKDGRVGLFGVRAQELNYNPKFQAKLASGDQDKKLDTVTISITSPGENSPQPSGDQLAREKVARQKAEMEYLKARAEELERLEQERLKEELKKQHQVREKKWAAQMNAQYTRDQEHARNKEQDAKDAAAMKAQEALAAEAKEREYQEIGEMFKEFQKRKDAQKDSEKKQEEAQKRANSKMRKLGAEEIGNRRKLSQYTSTLVEIFDKLNTNPQIPPSGNSENLFDPNNISKSLVVGKFLKEMDSDSVKSLNNNSSKDPQTLLASLNSSDASKSPEVSTVKDAFNVFLENHIKEERKLRNELEENRRAAAEMQAAERARQEAAARARQEAAERARQVEAEKQAAEAARAQREEAAARTQQAEAARAQTRQLTQNPDLNKWWNEKAAELDAEEKAAKLNAQLEAALRAQQVASEASTVQDGTATDELLGELQPLMLKGEFQPLMLKGEFQPLMLKDLVSDPTLLEAIQKGEALKSPYDQTKHDKTLEELEELKKPKSLESIYTEKSQSRSSSRESKKTYSIKIASDVLEPTITARKQLLESRKQEFEDYSQLKQKYNEFLKENVDKLDSRYEELKPQLTTFFKANFEILDEDTKKSLQETKIYKEYHKEQAEKQISQIQQSQQQTGGKNQNKLSSDNLLSLAQNVITSESQDTAETFSKLLTKNSENIDMRVLNQISQLFTKTQNTDIAKGAIEQKEANNKLKTIYTSKNVEGLNTKLKELELNNILTSVSEDSIKTFQDFLKTNSHLIDTKTFKSLGEKLKPNNAQGSVIISSNSNKDAINNLARFVKEKSQGFRVKDNLSYYGQLMVKTSLSSLGYDQKLLEIKRPSTSPGQPHTTQVQSNKLSRS